MKISIKRNAPESAYAAAELTRFLKEYTAAEIVFDKEAADHSVELVADGGSRRTITPFAGTEIR